MTYTALFDACVLYPAPLRDLLMSLAMEDLFRSRWTEEIHEEWMRNVLLNRPDLKADQLNRKDFPQTILQTFGIETQDPDSFLLYQLDLSPGKFLNAIRKHRARLKNPPMNQHAYLETLLRQKLPQLAQILKGYTQLF